MSIPSPEHTSVGVLARMWAVSPKQITQLFYERRLRDDLCPVVGGRRVIPLSYLPAIAAELRRKGIEVQDGNAAGDDQ